MSVKIKLKRIGKIHVPQYRIVIADSRAARNGRSIEEIGYYYPKQDPSFIEVNSDRVQHWLKVGAQPTEPVMVLLKITGDWQKFKGLPGAEGTLKVAAPKPTRRAGYDAAVADSDSARVTLDADRDAAKAKLATPVVVATPEPAAPVAEAALEPVAESAPVEAEAVEAVAEVAAEEVASDSEPTA